jgi:ankyrin repeat protein
VLNGRCSGGRQGYWTTTQLLFERGAEVDAPGGKYGNALQAAPFEGNMMVVQLLLKKGADVNAPGGEYDIAFLTTSLRGQT